MGQAAVELPNSSKTAAPAASADDLLSQLAGEEIDRLLAEADAGTPASSVTDGAEKVLEVFAADGQVKPASIRSEPAPAPAGELNAADQAEIERLLCAADSTTVPDNSAATPADDIETSSAERSALQDVSAAIEAQARADENSPDPLTAVANKLPLYLKPLQWINAPMMLFPAAVRQAIGKIAILTLFNALAVILYVVIFRRH